MYDPSIRRTKQDAGIPDSLDGDDRSPFLAIVEQTRRNPFLAIVLRNLRFLPKKRR
jgi:hypothetical protein